MAQATLTSVVGFLQEKELLTPSQVQQLSAKGQPLELGALLREAVRRQWLTAYQANRIAAGHPEELVVGAYRILEPIGEGGMGKVFKARHLRMDRIVALKIIPEEYVGNAAAVSRFYREIRAVAQLSHANIVTAYEANQERRTHYLAMEYLDGIDLAKLVKQSGPLPVSQACDFIRQAALGLQHAHEKGLVHRDIKPGNIVAARSSQDGDPVIKVLDFGLARLNTTDQFATRLTKAGSILGTVDYMSPEQAHDATVDIRSDIYSLGCSLFYLLTGRVPFPGNDAAGRLLARLMTDAPAIGTLRTDVPVALEKVLAKMLARDPAERFQTPIEVATALKPFANAAETVGRNPPNRVLPKANAVARPSDQAETISLNEAGVVDRVRQPREKVKVAAAEDFKDLISRRPSPSRKKSSKRPLFAVGIGAAALALLIGLRVGGLFGVRSADGDLGKNKPDENKRKQVQPAAPKITEPFTNSIGMKLVYIPRGRFSMGSPNSEKGRGADESAHEVEITSGFFMGAYEVTQEEYQKVIGKNPSWFSADGGGKEKVAGRDTRRFPVECVSWEGATAFCEKLSRKEDRDYDLPTEAEWEYACRAGTTTPFHFGETLNGREANCNGNLPYGTDLKGPNLECTCKVGLYPPNKFGLYDMHGNVMERCKGWWKQDYRSVRGGHWKGGAVHCRSACRIGYGPLSYWDVGFRVVLRLP